MGNILAAIENSAIRDIESGPVIWRIKKICSADLAKVGHAALAMSQGLESIKKNDGEEASAEQIEKMMASQTVEKLKTMAGLKDAIVAAGLIACGDPETQEFDRVQCVLESEKSNAAEGVLWVGAIPNHIADELFSAILDLSTDGGAAVERLRAFRGKSDQLDSDRSDSETLRQTAERGA